MRSMMADDRRDGRRATARQLAVVLVVSLGLLDGVAAAQPAKPAEPAVMAREMARGPAAGRWRAKPNCAVLLLRAHLMGLKNRLGLDDEQLTQVEKVRQPFLESAVKLRGEIERLHVTLGEQLAADLPDEAAVLDLEHQIHGLYGQFEDDGTKTYLKLLAVLTKEQRADLYRHCSTMGPPGMWMRRRAGRMGTMGMMGAKRPPAPSPAPAP